LESTASDGGKQLWESTSEKFKKAWETSVLNMENAPWAAAGHKEEEVLERIKAPIKRAKPEIINKEVLERIKAAIKRAKPEITGDDLSNKAESLYDTLGEQFQNSTEIMKEILNEDTLDQLLRGVNLTVTDLKDQLGPMVKKLLDMDVWKKANAQLEEMMTELIKKHKSGTKKSNFVLSSSTVFFSLVMSS